MMNVAVVTCHLNTALLAVAQVAISMAADSFDAYVGRYPLAPAVTLAVIRDGDALFLQLTAQPRFRMWPSAPDEFFLRDVDAQISFVRDSTGRVASLVLHQNGRNVPAPRTP